jgi:two-component system nitrogen regulation response regulator GlnG
VALDLSTIPRDLVGAQLFGSVKGAYTGSIGDRPGAFEEAQGGTLFLDEIGNLPEPTQKMLLTVLQEGVVTRIGESREREIDVKLVVASHEDLGAMVREGRFRQDLYMRLNPACTVALPPLCERDIPMEGLAEFFLHRALGTPTVADLVRSHRQAHSVAGDVVNVVIGDHVPAVKEGVLHVLLPARSLGLLREHPWPGNLRELAMVMENALVFALAESGPVGGRGDVVQCRPKLLRDLLFQTRGLAVQGAEDGFGLTVHLQPSDTLNRVAADVEQQYFRALFLKHEGDFRQMAEVLMGDPECARKVQLRFNQLGLKVREMKQRMG